MTYLERKKLAFMSIVNKVKGFIRTVTGVPPITLPSCVDENSIINYSIEGNSVQNVTPTPDAPIEVESVGDKTKNLFDISSVELIGECEVFENGIRFNGTGSFDVKLPSSQYTLSFKNNGKGTCYVRDGKVESGFIVSISPTETVKTLNFSASVDGYLRISSFTKGQTFSDIKIEQGSAATAYEPYGYKIPIVCSGKNLLNPKWLKRGAIPDSTGKPQSSTTRVYTDLISFEAGEYYMRISNYNNLSLRLRGIHTYNYDTEEWEGYSNWSAVMGKFFTISTRCKARFVFQTPSADIITVEDVVNGNPMITLKNAGTAYEPYVEPITTNIYLDEPLRKVGTYSDYIDFENKKLVRKVSETILNGTEECSYYTSSTTASYERIHYTHSIFGSTEGASLCNAINTTTSSDSGWNGTRFVMQVTSSGIFIYRPSYSGVLLDITSKTAWNNFLAERYQNGNPIKIYYILAGAIEEIISVPKIPTIKGTTIYTIGTTTQPSNMSATYYSTSKE